jgi:hypothetical protein
MFYADFVGGGQPDVAYAILRAYFAHGFLRSCKTTT